MSINPMELLKQNVSSVIIEEESYGINEKNDVLSRFYPILLYKFLLNPELIEQLKEKVKPSIFDLFERNDQLKNTLISRLSTGRVRMTEVEKTLNRAIPKSLAVLSNQIGEDTLSIIYYLKEHKNSIQALLPVWNGEIILPLCQVDRSQIPKMIKPISLNLALTKFYKILPFFMLLFASFYLIWLQHMIQ